METEWEEERERMRWKKINFNHRFTIRFGADEWGMIVRIVSVLLPTTVSWKVPKKTAELATLVLVIYADRFLLVVVIMLHVVVVSLSKTAVGTI